MFDVLFRIRFHILLLKQQIFSDLFIAINEITKRVCAYLFVFQLELLFEAQTFQDLVPGTWDCVKLWHYLLHLFTYLDRRHACDSDPFCDVMLVKGLS